VTVPAERAEPARGLMVELFPEGFEEADTGTEVELAAYTDSAGEERIRAVFEGAASQDVAADWADRWRRFHRSVRVGPVWIGPPWEEPPPDAVAVVIDPGRAFGTGGHPTTRLCIELLLDLERGALLDVGCGSGVIAITAAKLGFAPVFGLDREPQATDATARNGAVNEVDVDARLGDVLRDRLPAAEVVVANIDLATVSVVAERTSAPLLVVSGYVVSAPTELAGFRHADRRMSDGWAADLYVRE
jgi:ribosomal protein L11 methyltransferase